MAEQLVEPRLLGVPIQDANLISYRMCPGYGVEGHDLLCWVTTAESGGHFCALDLRTDKLDIKPLNHLEGYPLTPASDGCVYVGSTSGEIWRYRAAGSVWQPLARPWDDSGGKPLHHVRVLCEGADGWLYCGSCYGERARVNRQTGEVQALPPLTEPGNWYVSSVAPLPDGRVAFGLGYVARIIVYDPAQGKDVADWTPADWRNDGFVMTMLAGKSVLYANHFPSGRRGAFAITTGKCLGEVPWPAAKLFPKWSAWTHSAGYGAGIDYYLVPGTDTVLTCDGKLVHLWNPADGARALQPETLTVPKQLADELRWGVTTDLRVLEYDAPRLKVLKERSYEQPGAERGLFGMAIGPDGCLYGGAFQSTHLFRYDEKSGQLTDLGDHNPGWSGETYSLCNRGHELVCASYTNGAIVLYDPAKPWQCDNRAQLNPRFAGCLGQLTYRPLSSVAASDGRVWGVGAAGWGSTGGGVSWLNPDTGATGTTHLDTVPFHVAEVGTKTLLVADGASLRWWDTEHNAEVAHATWPSGAVSAVLMEREPVARIAFCDAARLYVARLPQVGKLELERTAALPFGVARLLWDGKRLIGGGSGGVAEFDPQTGTWLKYSATGPSSQFAFAATEKAVYFTQGPRLFSVERPQ